MSRLPVYLVIVLIAVGNFIPLFAHSGVPVAAPTKVSTTVTIDGTINSSGAEAIWAPGVTLGTLPNDCTELSGTAPPVTFFALNDGVNLYLAFDIPDRSAQPTDVLFLAFDPNHGGGTSPAGDDRAVALTFNNTAAVNVPPLAQTFSGTGSGWSAPVAGLPAGADAKYTRITTGTGKWQVEMRFPFTGTLGFAYIYINKTGTTGPDCNMDGDIDDFYAKYPSTLTFPTIFALPTDFPLPSAWADLTFGPQPPNVGFQPPLCCSSSDITFTPSAQPFTAGMPVSINAIVHNFHASSTANNVNVEIRVHNFGTGGAVIPPFPLTNQVAAISPGGTGSGTPVIWPSPPAATHGCIRAEIKPPTTSQYFIQAGQEMVQHNIDVACVPKGEKKALNFATYNPDEKQAAVKILLAKQVLLPKGFEGLTFDLKQPDRPLRAKEEFPVQLVVTAADTVPVTQVPKQTVRVPPTAGGAAVPPFRERTGTEPVSISVKPGERLHFATTGDVDIDGGGALPASGPDGQDVTNMIRERRPFLLRAEPASRYGGALIGSFDNFASSFVIGAEATLTVPDEAKGLLVAVNDFDSGYGDNTGKGFEVEVSTLPAFGGENSAKIAAATTAALMIAAPEVTLPQITITATSSSRATLGEASYNLLTTYGSATYQILVVEGGRGHLVGPHGSSLWKYILYVLLLLLIIIIIYFLWRRTRRRYAS
jgi:hypothetical protein